MANCDGHPRADLIVAGARGWVGTRFRRQGRGSEGLDCVGLVAAAAAGAGIRLCVPGWLPYRGLRPDEVTSLFCTAGCVEIDEGAAAGDILLRWAAARQPHLAIRTPGGLIEAHAGMGRIVERHLDAAEAWHSVWRLPEGGK